MNEEELKNRLMYDLSLINMPVSEVDIYLRPYSKTYYGRYFPVYDDNKDKPKIYLYPYKNRRGEFLDYEQILTTGIHEMCHHIQYMDKNFVRNKGVMHDSNFWRLYNHYVARAENFNLIGGEEPCELFGRNLRVAQNYS
jgi:hypothetical protein